MKLIKYILITIALITLNLQDLEAQCNASFTNSVSGLTASFTSTSTATPAITSFFWKFGDGITSTIANPVHTYSTNGTYYVVLIITNGVCTDSANMNVIAGCPVNANYFHSSTGLTAFFTSNSLGTSLNTTYSWDFGDLSTSTLQNPSHTYTTPGSYNVILEVWDSIGGSSCFDSIHKVVTVPMSGCSWVASFTHTSSGLTAFYTNTSLGTTATSSYLWKFGDGNTSTLQNPNHTYASSGNYLVGLEVSDTIGGYCLDTTSAFITVLNSNCPWTASFTESSTGLTSSFTNTSIGTTGTTDYFWLFGDGNTSMNPNPTHTYATAGNYTVTLYVSDTIGGYCQDTSILPITVNNISCPINASFSETISGLSVALNSTSTGLTPPANYSWNFGDATSGSGSSTSHTYSSQGVYSVTLTVSDTVCSDTTTRIIAVSSNVFTPNGDGIDDVFPLPCSGGAATVYNRSGVQVKTLAVGSPSWDGTNNLGGLEPTGLYFILCANSSSPIPVTLIR